MSREDWTWVTADGRILTMETVQDDHLVNIERYLLGRGELEFRAERFKTPEKYRECLDDVHREIERRGLIPRFDTATEAFERMIRRIDMTEDTPIGKKKRRARSVQQDPDGIQ